MIQPATNFSIYAKHLSLRPLSAANASIPELNWRGQQRIWYALFAGDVDGVTPDIVAIAKGLGAARIALDW